MLLCDSYKSIQSSIATLRWDVCPEEEQPEGLGWAFSLPPLPPPLSELQVNLRVRGEEGSWLVAKMEMNI